MTSKIKIAGLALGLTLALGAAGFAHAQGHGGHGGHGGHAGHGAMPAPAHSGEVVAAAIIHKVDAKAGTINVTHDPIKEIGWPKMTMDLAVTRRVDLSQVKPGAKVKIKLKLGRDKQYRVIEIMPN